MNLQRLWSLGRGDPKSQKAWDLPTFKGNWDNMLLEADQVSRARLKPRYRKRAGLGSMLCRFRLKHY